jgi:head-tail adaptor
MSPAMSPARHPAIGARRHRFVIEQPQEVPDGIGGVVRGFAAAGHVWGELVARSGDEPFEAGGFAPRRELALRVRGFGGPPLDPGMRLRLRARLFDILAVLDPDGRGRTRLVLLQEQPATENPA